MSAQYRQEESMCLYIINRRRAFSHPHQFHSTEASHPQSADYIDIIKRHAGEEVGLCLQPTGSRGGHSKKKKFNEVSFWIYVKSAKEDVINVCIHPLWRRKCAFLLIDKRPVLVTVWAVMVSFPELLL